MRRKDTKVEGGGVLVLFEILIEVVGLFDFNRLVEAAVVASSAIAAAAAILLVDALNLIVGIAGV